jgi:DNA-binding NarL/FixJ family response regulator
VIRVAVIDNDRLVPAGLRTLLAETEEGNGIELVCTGTSVADFLHQQAEPCPPVDVVLLDLQLEDGSLPAENVAALRTTGTRVLVFSVHGDRRHIRATIRAGACGYLIKDDDGVKLAQAIRTVHVGGLALTTELMVLINDDPPELSAQELQVLYLYGTGSTLAATARRLGIAVPTVRSYLDRIRAKWAAADEPVDDVRDLIHEYRPQRDPG